MKVSWQRKPNPEPPSCVYRTKVSPKCIYMCKCVDSRYTEYFNHTDLWLGFLDFGHLRDLKQINR